MKHQLALWARSGVSTPGLSVVLRPAPPLAAVGSSPPDSQGWVLRDPVRRWRPPLFSRLDHSLSFAWKLSLSLRPSRLKSVSPAQELTFAQPELAQKGVQDRPRSSAALLLQGLASACCCLRRPPSRPARRRQVLAVVEEGEEEGSPGLEREAEVRPLHLEAVQGGAGLG